MTRYVLQRRGDGWGWIGANQWIDVLELARTFEFIADVEMTGLVECQIPHDEWCVVGVEIPEPVDAA